MVVLARIVALGALASAALVFAAPHLVAQGPPRRTVHVVAERFSFTPAHITVEAGTLVEIRLTSEDTAHGFRIVGPRGVDVTIPKRNRGEIVVPFRATEPGDYVF